MFSVLRKQLCMIFQKLAAKLPNLIITFSQFESECRHSNLDCISTLDCSSMTKKTAQ
jgi:hypothetical protein